MVGIARMYMPSRRHMVNFALTSTLTHHILFQTQTHVRVYNLQKQTMLKNIRANSRWVSSISVHPGGEHFLIGTFDRKVSW